MYTGEMNLDQRSVQDILVAADMIQLKEVSCTVGNFLENEFWTPPPPINFVHASNI